jgi:hypothetical protein
MVPQEQRFVRSGKDGCRNKALLGDVERSGMIKGFHKGRDDVGWRGAVNLSAGAARWGGTEVRRA